MLLKSDTQVDMSAEEVVLEELGFQKLLENKERYCCSVTPPWGTTENCLDSTSEEAGLPGGVLLRSRTVEINLNESI